jgi:hypothetical protein
MEEVYTSHIRKTQLSLEIMLTYDHNCDQIALKALLELNKTPEPNPSHNSKTGSIVTIDLTLALNAC